MQQEFRSTLIKWGTMAMLTVLVTGLMNLANRNVYSKTEVDTLLSNAAELQRVRDAAVTEKLNRIETTGRETQTMLIQLLKERQ